MIEEMGILWFVIKVAGIACGLGWLVFWPIDREWADTIAIPAFLGLPIIVVLIIIAGIMMFTAPREDYIVEKPIFALDGSTWLYGRFALGTGQIEQRPCFYYYTGSTAALELEKVEATICSVRQLPQCKPVAIYHYHQRCGWRTKWVGRGRSWHPYRVELLVPFGTVEYKFDAGIDNF